jgi:hypothetical protein
LAFDIADKKLFVSVLDGYSQDGIHRIGGDPLGLYALRCRHPSNPNGNTRYCSGQRITTSRSPQTHTDAGAQTEKDS